MARAKGFQLSFKQKFACKAERDRKVHLSDEADEGKRGVVVSRIVQAVLLTLALAVPLRAATPWNAAPWIEDLNQIRAAVESQYPNRDWLIEQREISLDREFGRTESALKASDSDATARIILSRLAERFADGHVSLRWPSSRKQTPNTIKPDIPATAAAFCAANGYDAGQVTVGTASALPGYQNIEASGPFAAGLVRSKGSLIGVVRLGVFSVQGYPAFCEQAVASLRIGIDQPCDDACADRLSNEAYAQMTLSFIKTIEKLRAAGAKSLLIDITRNGGGSEWAEAAARIVSPVPLRSAPISVVRSEKQVRYWRELSETLRKEALTTLPAGRSILLVYADKADAIANALRPCEDSKCSLLVSAGYASGLLSERPADTFSGKAWGASVFGPTQFPYRDAVWQGPVIMLVDGQTWSAAEQFAALLRDNEAAVIMGERTGCAGCGHINGNDPITLTNNGGILELPNCARFRKDGSNEVNGIVPDVATGVRWNDGRAFAGETTAAQLTNAIEQAKKQFWARRR
jgi:hypothetical protein